jgi:GntR family transcriptional regulator
MIQAESSLSLARLGRRRSGSPEEAENWRRWFVALFVMMAPRLLDKRIVAADEAVAHDLALAPGTLVVRLQRVRSADGVAMSFDETYLPRDLGRRLRRTTLRPSRSFALLENKYDTPLVEAEYELEAAAADPIVAQALQVPPGTPIFLIARTLYTTGNRPADYERLHYRGDLIRFVTRLARRAKASMQR